VDNSVMMVVVIGMFAIVLIVVALFFRQRIKAKIKGPAGLSLEVDGTNAPPSSTPGVRVEAVTSRRGGLVAEDATGRGAEVKKADVEQDIRVSSTPPKGDPKA
jgi:hypothetical protein